MKPYEVACFKRFIYNSGMDTLFISSYRTQRRPMNPISLEEYLFMVDYDKVCMMAFNFSNTSDFGYTYWKKMQDKFEAFLERNWNEEHAPLWYRLKGYRRKMLTQNWDDAKFWNHETKAVALARINAILLKVGMKEYIYKKDVEEDETKETPVETQSSILDDLEFLSYDINKAKARLGDDEVSLNMRSRFTLAFNQKLSRMIIENDNYGYASLARTSNGMVVLVLNSNERDGAKLNNKHFDNEKYNVCVNSKVIVSKIHTLLNIKKDYEILNIKVLEQRPTYIVFKLSCKPNE